MNNQYYFFEPAVIQQQANQLENATKNEKAMRLTIYGDILTDDCGNNLAQEIDSLDTDVLEVYINSLGGSVQEGVGIYSALKRNKAKIITYADWACSISSVIFMAGGERVVYPTSMLMVHNAWAFIRGNPAELRKQADDLDKITQASIAAYMEHVTISKQELEELLDKETWLTAEEAVAMGFATRIEKAAVTTYPEQSVRANLMQYTGKAKQSVSIDYPFLAEQFELLLEKLNLQIKKTISETVNIGGKPTVKPEPEPANLKNHLQRCFESLGTLKGD